MSDARSLKGFDEPVALYAVTRSQPDGFGSLGALALAAVDRSFGPCWVD